MLQRVAGWMVVWFGLATGVLVAVGAIGFAVFALDGGLQAALETDAPPQGVFEQFVLLFAIIALYLFAAAIFTVALAVVQLQIGPWWAVVVGLCALAAGAGLLVVAGTGANDRLAFLGFAGYMVATNWVALQGRQLNAIVAGAGLASALLLLASSLTPGVAGAGLFALAIALYGGWVVWLAIAVRRGRARGQTVEPLQPALQSQPAARYNSPVPPTGRFRAP